MCGPFFLVFFGFLCLAYNPKSTYVGAFMAFWLPKFKSQKSIYLGAFWLLSQSQKAKKKPKQKGPKYPSETK
jgi:hypothetical protein